MEERVELEETEQLSLVDDAVIEYLLFIEDVELANLLLKRCKESVELFRPATCLRYYLLKLQIENQRKRDMNNYSKVLTNLDNSLACLEESIKNFLKRETVQRELHDKLLNAHHESTELRSDIRNFLRSIKKEGSESKTQLRKRIESLCDRCDQLVKNVDIGPALLTHVLSEWDKEKLTALAQQGNVFQNLTKNTQQKPSEIVSREPSKTKGGKLIASSADLMRLAKDFGLNWNSIKQQEHSSIKQFLKMREEDNKFSKTRKVVANLRNQSEKLSKTAVDPLADALKALNQVQNTKNRLNERNETATRVVERFLTSESDSEDVDPVKIFRQVPVSKLIEDTEPKALDSVKKKPRKSGLSSATKKQGTKRSRDRLNSSKEIAEGKKKRKKTVPFSKAEEEHLRNGVEKFGEGHWATILANYNFDPSRGSMALRDKWRNLKKYNKV